MASALFADVEQAGGGCVFAARLDALPDIYGNELAFGWPEHANLSDVNVVAGMRFLENGLTVDAEIRSKNSEINKYYEQLALLGGTSGDHTAEYVPVFAIGAGSQAFSGKMDNTDIPKRIAKAAGYK